MREVKINCDGCGKDITSTDAMPRFRLHLLAEALSHTSAIVYAIIRQPPIEEDCYFCDFDCLRNWITTKA